MSVTSIILSVLLVLSFVLIIYVYHQERKLSKTYLDVAYLYKTQVEYLIKWNERKLKELDEKLEQKENVDD